MAEIKDKNNKKEVDKKLETINNKRVKKNNSNNNSKSKQNKNNKNVPKNVKNIINNTVNDVKKEVKEVIEEVKVVIDADSDKNKNNKKNSNLKKNSNVKKNSEKNDVVTDKTKKDIEKIVNKEFKKSNKKKKKKKKSNTYQYNKRILEKQKQNKITKDLENTKNIEILDNTKEIEILDNTKEIEILDETKKIEAINDDNDVIRDDIIVDSKDSELSDTDKYKKLKNELDDLYDNDDLEKVSVTKTVDINDKLLLVDNILTKESLENIVYDEIDDLDVTDEEYSGLFWDLFIGLLIVIFTILCVLFVWILVFIMTY